MKKFVEQTNARYWLLLFPLKTAIRLLFFPYTTCTSHKSHYRFFLKKVLLDDDAKDLDPANLYPLVAIQAYAFRNTPAWKSKFLLLPTVC